jgi:hypothetical protein
LIQLKTEKCIRISFINTSHHGNDRIITLGLHLAASTIKGPRRHGWMRESRFDAQ